jgi:hypothetical protein
MKRSTGAAEPNSDVHGVETVLESADVEFIDTPPIGWETVARFLRNASKDDKIDITRTRSTILLLTRPIFGPQDPAQTAMRGTEALVMSITIIKKKPPPPKAPDEVVALRDQDFFGPPPLIPGEDPRAYDALLRQVTNAVRPKDVFEKIFVRDFADRTWETYRLRRFRDAVFQTYAHNRVSEILENSGADELPRNWARGDSKALEEVNSRLAALGLTIDGLMAEAFAANLPDLALLDRMLAGTEARRNQVLRELERHGNSIVAKSLRDFAIPRTDGFYATDGEQF